MKSQPQKMTQIFSAFSAWAGRGLRISRSGVRPVDDVVQEYEAAVMPVLPQWPQSTYDEHAAR